MGGSWIGRKSYAIHANLLSDGNFCMATSGYVYSFVGVILVEWSNVSHAINI